MSIRVLYLTVALGILLGLPSADAKRRFHPDSDEDMFSMKEHTRHDEDDDDDDHFGHGIDPKGWDGWGEADDMLHQRHLKHL
ncbi:hypothetical protein BVRB_033430, partial [Beta vulgaris subsp. vulgaris]